MKQNPYKETEAITLTKHNNTTTAHQVIIIIVFTKNNIP